MALNANIILAGQTPDIMGTIGRANDMAQQRIGYDRQNALAQMYQDKGPGIMAGDLSAMNALAQFDPNAALGVQQTRQGMAATQQRMDILSREEARSVQKEAASLTAEQRKAEAQKLEGALKGAAYFYSKGDRAGYENFLRQSGADPAQFPFDQFEPIAAKMGGILEVLKGFQPEISPNDRYKVAGGTLFDLGAEGGPVAVGQGAMQEETIFGPDGKPIIVRGGPGSNARPPTEGQLAGAGYLQRMTGAEKIINDLSSSGMDAIPLIKSMALDTKAEGYALSPAEASLAQAQRDWVRAKLRKESGAVIADEEMASEIKTYFPLPGEGPEIIAQKREARRRAERQMQIGSGSAAPLAGELTPSANEPAQSTGQGGVPSPGDIDGGYRFKGGDPSDPNSWEPAQ